MTRNLGLGPMFKDLNILPGILDFPIVHQEASEDSHWGINICYGKVVPVSGRDGMLQVYSISR
jgi:hypothetical protein